MQHRGLGILPAAAMVVLLGSPAPAQDCTGRLEDVSAQLQPPAELRAEYPELLGSTRDFAERHRERLCLALGGGPEDAVVHLAQAVPGDVAQVDVEINPERPGSVEPEDLDLGELPPRPPAPKPAMEAARDGPESPEQEADPEAAPFDRTGRAPGGPPADAPIYDMTAAQLIGQPVLDQRGRMIAELSDIVLGGDGQLYGVLDPTETLETPAEQIAVPFSWLTLVADRIKLAADVTRHDLEQMAAREDGGGRSVTGPGALRDVEGVDWDGA